MAKTMSMQQNSSQPHAAYGASLDVPPGSEPYSHRSRSPWVVWAALIVVLVGGLLAYRLAARNQQGSRSASAAAVPTVAVRAGTVQDVIRVDGQLSARNYASIRMPRLRYGRGQLTLKQLVPGGTLVHKGDVVAALDDTNQVETLDNFEDNLSQAKANLQRRIAQRQVDVERLQQNLRSRKAAMDKAVGDNRAGEVKSPVEKALLELQVEQTTAQYKQTQESEALQEVSIAADMAGYQITFERLQNRRDQVAQDLENFTFRAPVDGLAVIQTFNRGTSNSVQYQVGDRISPGQTLLKIVDPLSLQLEARANQVEARRLRIGMPAKIAVDAFPEVTLSGTVQSVGVIAAATRMGSYYVRTVPVIVRFQGLDSRLFPDLSAAATVTIASKEGVLTIPREAVHLEGGAPHVHVRTVEGFAKQDVELGLSGATAVEVVSGLQAGQRIALTEPPAAR